MHFQLAAVCKVGGAPQEWAIDVGQSNAASAVFWYHMANYPAIGDEVV